MAKSTKEEIAELKSTIVDLAKKLEDMGKELKMTMYDQRKMEVDWNLKHNEMEHVLDRKIKVENYELGEQYKKNLKKLDEQQAEMQEKLDEVLSTIQDNIVQKQDMRQWIVDEVTTECQTQREDLEQFVRESIVENVQKAQETLQKTLHDEVVGDGAIRAMGTEVKLIDFLNAKTEEHKDQLEQQLTRMITETLDTEEQKHRDTVDQWLTKAVEASVKRLKTELTEHFVESQQATMDMHKEELGDRLQEEVNDILEENKKLLQRSLVRELKEMVQGQEKEWLKVIRTLLKKGLEEVHKTVRKDMQQLAEQQRSRIDDILQAKTVQLKQDLKVYLDDQMELRTKEVQALLSEHFEGNLRRLQNKIEENHRKWKEMLREIYELDTKYHAKVPFLLERYSTKFTWRLESFHKMVDDLRNRRVTEVNSDIFYTNGDDLEMQARLALHGKDLYVKTTFLAADHDPDVERQPSYAHRRTVALLNQIEPGDGRNRVRIQEPSFGWKDIRNMALGDYDGARVFDPLDGTVHNDAFISNDSAIVQILIEPLHILYKSYATDNGTLLWRIDHFSRLKQDGRDGLTECVYSDYFYSDVCGYRLQLTLYLQTTNLTFMLRFLHGEWDDFLSQRFPHTSTLTILDQSNSANKEHLSKILASTTTTIDLWRNFAPQSQVQNPMYCKDDTVLVQVHVKPDTDGVWRWAAEVDESSVPGTAAPLATSTPATHRH